MAEYYKTNAIYTELEKYADIPFVWTSGNAWILLYADNTAEVKIVATVLGHSTRRVNKKIKSRIETAQSKAVTLAKAASAIFATIEFDDEATEIDKVTLNGHTATLSELKDWFAKAGLAVKGSATSKAINDAASSAYHKWQRENLGAIKVSDMDLLRLDPDTGGVVEILELKRSFISLENWRPYPVDFQNFNVIENLATRVGVRFTIAYNVRITQPTFRDDASLISLFDYSRKGGARAKGIIPFESFLKGRIPK